MLKHSLRTYSSKESIEVQGHYFFQGRPPSFSDLCRPIRQHCPTALMNFCTCVLEPGVLTLVGLTLYPLPNRPNVRKQKALTSLIVLFIALRISVVVATIKIIVSHVVTTESYQFISWAAEQCSIYRFCGNDGHRSQA